MKPHSKPIELYARAPLSCIDSGSVADYEELGGRSYLSISESF
jgi:hypothetical protein